MSHPIPGHDYPCETCGYEPHDCECEPPETPKNEFETAADAYLATAGDVERVTHALRLAFYAGVKYGMNSAYDSASKIYTSKRS